MSLSSLSNKTLLISYQEAIKLKLSPDFIRILEMEIINRELFLESYQVRRLKKIE